MKRLPCVKWLGCVLLQMTLLVGVVHAEPTGSANVSQMMLGVTGTPSPLAIQRTFLTTDIIAFAALYYDDDVACAGQPPLFAQLFVFNLEGLFVGVVDALTAPAVEAGSAKYRSVAIALPAAVLGPGSFKFTYLVRSCDDSKSVILPELLTFRVVAP
jgi:hypothetical protein